MDSGVRGKFWQSCHGNLTKCHWQERNWPIWYILSRGSSGDHWCVQSFFHFLSGMFVELRGSNCGMIGLSNFVGSGTWSIISLGSPGSIISEFSHVILKPGRSSCPALIVLFLSNMLSVSSFSLNPSLLCSKSRPSYISM